MLSRHVYLIVSSVSLLAACAGDPPPPAAAPAPVAPSSASATATAATHAAELKAAGDAKVGDRTKCPTSGEEFVVTADSPKVEYQGKTYYFCCSGCDNKFAKDPEKFLKKPGA
ncbi:MAG: YHS domain-containing protein [Labilithrix sp.]|nr:YHS domain-containing protein [Labilithrix sp.]MCW5811583.1 YHS domain-containing protein [Labilithrix sp.]